MSDGSASGSGLWWESLIQGGIQYANNKQQADAARDLASINASKSTAPPVSMWPTWLGNAPSPAGAGNSPAIAAQVGGVDLRGLVVPVLGFLAIFVGLKVFKVI